MYILRKYLGGLIFKEALFIQVRHMPCTLFSVEYIAVHKLDVVPLFFKTISPAMGDFFFEERIKNLLLYKEYFFACK